MGSAKMQNAKDPLISVVVLTHAKREKLLWRCLNSIKSSHYKNKEVILIINGYIPRLAKTINLKYPWVNIIQLPVNTGIFFGFNVGFMNAKGDYIIALDDDIAIKPDTLDKFVRAFQEKPKDVMVISPNAYNPTTKHYYVPPSTKNMISFHGASAFRKSGFEKTGYYDEDFFRSVGADDLAIKIVNAGYKIYFASAIVIDHFEKTTKMRAKQIFFTARNKSWLNIKHFSIKFIPLLIIRDLIWIILLPYRRKSVKTWVYGVAGYIFGYLNFVTPLKKRHVVSSSTQKIFLRSYLFGDFIAIKNRFRS